MKNKLASLVFLMVCVALAAPAAHSNSGSVYICVTGKVYHSTKNCWGLSNATHKVKAVSLSEAQKKRRPCKICF